MKPATGALIQLPGEAGCISTSNEGCADGTAINGPEDLVVSPDGKNIYANSYNDNAVIELDRNPETGMPSTNRDASRARWRAKPEACTQAKSIGGAARRGDQPRRPEPVRQRAFDEDAVAAFERDPETGDAGAAAGTVRMRDLKLQRLRQRVDRTDRARRPTAPDRESRRRSTCTSPVRALDRRGARTARSRLRSSAIRTSRAPPACS